MENEKVDYETAAEAQKVFNQIHEAEKEFERTGITVGRMFDSPISRAFGTVFDNVKWFFQDLAA
jgi:hypothetical protein